MTYSIPTTVQTKEQAILALASTIAGEAVTGGDGSVNKALDVLADVLAGQDVQVPQTNAGAILALADYVSGGGGGSSDLTTAQVTFTYTHEETGNTGFSLPIANEAKGFPFDTPARSDAESIDSFFNGETVSVILYKGLCTAYYDGTGTVTTNGYINYHNSNHLIEIAGDGSITIS